MCNKLLAILFACWLPVGFALNFQPVAGGGEVAKTTFKGVDYVIFHAQPVNVRLLWQNEYGKNYRNLANAGKALQAQGETVVMMMNAGIYSSDYRPAGLWVENGQMLQALNTQRGSGNFHIQPNGVFWVRGEKVGIMQSSAWAKFTPVSDYALQSGPLLLIDGEINSRFVRDLSSPYKRNAVCLTQTNDLYFVITTAYDEEWPSFYRLAEAMQSFGCYQALYLDGAISNYYLKGMSDWFHWKPFVGIIAVIASH